VRLVLAAPAVTLAAVMLGGPAVAAQRGYLFSIVGRVMSTDPARGVLVLRHGMLETMSAGDETCQVARDALRGVRPGMTITATADTRHRPWRLRWIRPFDARGERPHLGGRVVAMAETAR
jgi:hypothetical protein